MLPGHPHRPTITPLITILPTPAGLIKINAHGFSKHKRALSQAGLIQINTPLREQI
jgi:hypothetical protein